MLAELQKILADATGVDVNEINADSSMNNTEGWDSMRYLEVMVAIESHFGVKFNLNEMTQLTSVENIIRVLGQKSQTKQLDNK